MLNRPLTGLVTGAALGAIDGLSALLTSPEVSDQIAGIVVGSTVKGLLAGVIVGSIARRFRAPGPGVGVGVVVASLVTFPIAYMNATHYGRPDYYWKIMLPGALVGAIVGYVVVRYGRPPAPVSIA
jgi:gas vesicle protein